MQEPMKNKIHYSAEAQRDLDDIWDYVKIDLGNSNAAERIVNHIMDDVEQLGSFAELGAKLSSITETESDYRFLVTGNYMTFYRVSGTNVYVDRILYGRRDYLRTLFGQMLDAEAHQ